MLWLPSAGRKMLVIAHQKPRDPLEIGVGLPLLLKHGNRPAGRAGMDRFVIPIGPFHQPHPNRRAAPSSPIAQINQIVFGIAQIALNHDADVGQIAKFVLHEHALKYVQREILDPIRFHIDMHMGMLLCSRPQNRPQPLRNALGTAFGIDRIELAIEGREFDRHIHARQRMTAIRSICGISGQAFTVGPSCSIKFR